MINTFRLSFYGNGKTLETFVGLKNFQNILFGSETSIPAQAIHEEFFNYFQNTIIIWLGNFVPQIILSLLLAVWFTDAKLKIPGKGFFKVIMYMPNIITAASVSALFLVLFGDGKYGAINSLLLSKEMIVEPIRFITDKTNSRILVMFIQTWMWFGNTMIMLMSGIMGINPSLFEAANIDGANSFQIFRKVTLPLLRPIMVYTLITSMIGGLQMFDIPYLLHTGNTLVPHIQTAAVFVYEKFHKTPYSPSYGYSAAASVILFFITGILGIFVFFFNRDKDEAEQKKKLKKLKKQAKMRNKGFGGLDL
ncbi:carbohydrate ABC transporter permease [Ruminococcus champanellensis]|uniref:carbohydrate ABC transporter permease n=1 Tax=Ruminococcus champanellensis TaxID=1161942 RepID=UPI002E77170F|nr:sugar ABC transporter permease [Ruminococcus champanellensis]MED9892452.1 sugar ABC transporter permease [Ruminococcus champanellensis]